MTFLYQKSRCLIEAFSLHLKHLLLFLPTTMYEGSFLGVIVFGIVLLIGVAVIAAFITVGIFLIRALNRYVKSGNVRKEKSIIKKSLGEVLKQHREECKMTQEFVAESIGVSRQAVSKWETGAADPSTSNLLTLAKLFNTTAEELLREVQ